MVKTFQRFFIFSLTLVLFFLVFASSAFAAESIKNFEVDITAKKDGSMVVSEKITYDFGETNRHGIFRFIPLVSKVGDLFRVIKVDFTSVKRDNLGEKYSVNQGAKKTEVKIGDPDKTIVGSHIYEINYTATNGIGSNYSDHDEIYWNVTGNDWNVPIDQVSATLKTNFGVSVLEAICFSGTAGSTQRQCEVTDNANGKTITSLQPLAVGEGLTLVASFPVNTFPDSVLQKNEPFADPDLIKFLIIYAVVWFFLNLILVPIILFWYFRQPRKAKLGKAAVSFDLPQYDKNQIVLPAQAGIIDTFQLEKDDIIATIFDLAIKKYLKIEEVTVEKTLLPDENDYKFVKLKDYDGNDSFERELFESLFSAGSGETTLKSFGKDFYKTFEKLEKTSFNNLIAKSFYTKNPKVQRGSLLVVGLLALLTLNIFLGAILIYLSRKLTGRTQLGDKIDLQVDGLKIFLKSVARYQGWQAKNLITVEKYIPYAIAFGFQEEFMKQLKLVYPDYSPSWYLGSHGFYYGFPLIYSSMNSNVTTSAPSSSSGFSGGSSGGGGGGGGGGSW